MCDHDPFCDGKGPAHEARNRHWSRIRLSKHHFPACEIIDDPYTFQYDER